MWANGHPSRCEAFRRDVFWPQVGRRANLGTTIINHACSSIHPIVARPPKTTKAGVGLRVVIRPDEFRRWVYSLLIYVTDERPAATSNADRKTRNTLATTPSLLLSKKSATSTLAISRRLRALIQATDFNQTGYNLVQLHVRVSDNAYVCLWCARTSCPLERRAIFRNTSRFQIHCRSTFV